MKQSFYSRVFTCCLCLIFLVGNLKAADIKGVLKNEKQEIITNQKVFLTDDLFTTTDEKGGFLFVKVKPDTYDLTTISEGQIIILKTIVVSNPSDYINIGDVVLIIKNVQLKEIEISENYTNRHFDRLSEVSNNVIYSGKKNEVLLLDRIDGNKAQNNPRQILGRIPGMNFSETEGSGFPSNGFGLRGLNPTQSIEMNTRQNGYNITADLYGYNEAYYNPAMEAVEKIEVVRGASSLQFGPQFGGVVNFVMKQGSKLKPFEYTTYQTVGSYGMFNSFHSIGGTYKKWNYYAYGQYKNSLGWRPNSQSAAVTGYAKVEYNATEKLKVGLEYSVLRNRIQMAGGLTDEQFEKDGKQSFRARNWLNSPWNVVTATLDYKFSPNASLTIKSTYLFSKRNLVWKNEDGGPGEMDSISPVTNDYVSREVQRESFSSSTTEARFLGHYMLFKRKQTLAVGLRYFTGKMKRQGGGPGSTGSDFDLNLYGGDYEYALNYTTQNIAPFVEHVFRITNKFSITPGFRYEIINSTSKGYVTDSIKIYNDDSRTRYIPLVGIGAEYKVSSSTNVYANWSQAYRPMDYSSLTPIGVSSKIDPNLKDASGYNADLGWRGIFGRFLNFDVSAFYMVYQNRVGLLSATDPLGSNYTLRTNTGNSISQGVETYIEINPVKIFTQHSKYGYLNLFNSFAFIDAKYTSGEDENGNSFKGNKVEYAPKTINRCGITYGIKMFSITYQVSNTAKSYGDANNTEKSVDAIIGVIPSYQVMDISATYKINNFNIKAGLNNVTDARYFTKRTDEYPGPGIIPSIGRTFYVGFGANF